MRIEISRLAIFLLALHCVVPALAAAQSERRLSDVLEAADRAWTAQRHDEALAEYEEVVRRDSTASRALFRLATLLSWRNELSRSIRLLHEYARLEPGDDDARVALARTLAWSGHYDESMVTYDSVLARHPGHRDAVLGAAQTLAWSGRLTDAIGRHETWLRDNPDDADAWSALGRVCRWAGRPGAARRALRRAIEVSPGHQEAIAELRWVEVELAPSLEPAITTTNDSDDSRSTLYVVETGIAMPWGARLRAGASHRVAELAAARGTATTARVVTSWTPAGGRWTLRGEAGATRLDGSEAPAAPSRTRAEPLIAARVSGRMAQRMSLGIGASRAAFDETAPLIIAGISTTTFEGDAELALHQRLALGAGGSITRLSGGSVPNRRDAVTGVLRWTLPRRTSVAAGVRTFGYERSAADGYFAPRRYLLAEGSMRAALGAELGWGLDADVGLGHQTITAFDGSTASRFAQRANAALTYRPAPGFAWSIAGAFANVASPTTVSSAEYRVWSLSLRGRVRL
ncbi:MAG TPA: tetratricopeptide repeat protein [Gemmatimonadaceae bacterium]|nr:tetratricopeptide repeat protein [Gemmatimonadaceae bacterium]